VPQKRLACPRLDSISGVVESRRLLVDVISLPTTLSCLMSMPASASFLRLVRRLNDRRNGDDRIVFCHLTLLREETAPRETFADPLGRGNEPESPSALVGRQNDSRIVRVKTPRKTTQLYVLRGHEAAGGRVMQTISGSACEVAGRRRSRRTPEPRHAGKLLKPTTFPRQPTSLLERRAFSRQATD